MSNNKQIMKLYTEEQVKEMLNKINALLPSDDKESLLKYAVEHITHYMTPIELPSDEEIEKLIGVEWWEGAKWMRDKIQGGNK